jgi:hypothetical protein
VRILEGRPIATIDSVQSIDLPEFEDAWTDEIARVAATYIEGHPRPIFPTICTSVGEIDVWLAPADDVSTGVPSGTLVGATYARATGEAWTVEVPMVPWACRVEPFVDCTFGFLDLTGAQVEYGRPFASWVLRPADHCTVDNALCEYANRDPDPCTETSPGATCVETAWVRAVCATPSFDALAPAATPYCRDWNR